jgi:hypothetical protein
MITPKGTSILSADIQFNTQCTERLSSDTVCMNGGNDIRSRLMNSTVDHKSSSVDRVHVSAFTNFTVLIDENEIGRSNGLERSENGVNPEMIVFDGIADRNVPRSTFITVTVLAHPAESLQ